jgi:hypothetical protein
MVTMLVLASCFHMSVYACMCGFDYISLSPIFFRSLDRGNMLLHYTACWVYGKPLTSSGMSSQRFHVSLQPMRYLDLWQPAIITMWQYLWCVDHPLEAVAFAFPFRRHQIFRILWGRKSACRWWTSIWLSIAQKSHVTPPSVQRAFWLWYLYVFQAYLQA